MQAGLTKVRLIITQKKNATLDLPTLDLIDFFGLKLRPNETTFMLNGVPIGNDLTFTDFGNNCLRVQKDDFIDLKANAENILEWENLMNSE